MNILMKLGPGFQMRLRSADNWCLVTLPVTLLPRARIVIEPENGYKLTNVVFRLGDDYLDLEPGTRIEDFIVPMSTQIQAGTVIRIECVKLKKG